MEETTKQLWLKGFKEFMEKQLVEGEVTKFPLLSSFNMSKVGEPVRIFPSGANRSPDVGKLDYDGFLSPTVLERYAMYMHKNRHLPDGSLRDSDNWQKGIPLTAYMKSAWRHFVDWWRIHRAGDDQLGELEEALCAMIFNSCGYLHEVLKRKNSNEQSSHNRA